MPAWIQAFIAEHGLDDTSSIPSPMRAKLCEALLPYAAAPCARPPGQGTFGHTGQALACTMRDVGERRCERSRRADLLNAAPPALLALGSVALGTDALAALGVRRGAKGAKHAAACGSPWVAALAGMPPPPPNGPQRARLGLADVAGDAAADNAVEREREARALTAILPFEVAPWLLSSSAETVAAMDSSQVAECLVEVLKEHGKGALHAAYSCLGRLLAWVRATYPSATVLEGVHVLAWRAAAGPSANTNAVPPTGGACPPASRPTEPKLTSR
jgi:hypothetical protein